jgi:hypothetical protein
VKRQRRMSQRMQEAIDNGEDLDLAGMASGAQYASLGACDSCNLSGQEPATGGLTSMAQGFGKPG